MSSSSNIFGLNPPATAKNKAGALAIIAGAMALGLSADMLLRAWPWGLNASIWLTGLCVMALVLPRIELLGLPRARGTAWLCAAAAFSLMLVWRASPVLQALNIVAAFVCLGMVAFRTVAASVRVGSMTDYAGNAAVSLVQADVGMAVLLTRQVDWSSVGGRGHAVRVSAMGRGLAFAAVPLVVFGGLFASADVFFRDLLEDILFIDLTEVFTHLFFFALFGWLAGGYLWGALLAEREPVPDVPRIGWVRLDFIELGMVFGLVNALFLLFVGVQFRYLFGGADVVESSSTLTYAEYARRGFFELVAAAGLAAVFVLFAHWLLPRGQGRLQAFFACAAGVLIVLVFVVMASALQRMRLYTDTFGLTELRLYTTAFMVWLFAVFAWMAFTVLRGRRDRFAFGVFVAGLAVVVGLNAINPDGFIVERNAAIVDDGRPFDAEYALSLSADSVPALVENFERVPAAEQCSIARELRERYLDADEGWRSWSWARSRAEEAVRSSDELATACDG